MRSPSRRLWAAGIALSAVCTAGVVQAASSVLIWPIDPVLEADQQASALWLENRGTEPRACRYACSRGARAASMSNTRTSAM